MSDPPDRDPSGAANTSPVGTGEHIVRQGECIQSIAWQHGIHPDALWHLDGNADLRGHRDPSMLLPGDRVAVPARGATGRTLAVSSGGNVRARVSIPRSEVKLRFQIGGEPRSNLRYTAVFDGERQEGTTDGDGVATLNVRASTRRICITLHDTDDAGEFDEVLHFAVGGLDPHDSVSGAQARLGNLGFHPGPVDGDAGPRTQAAVRAFQRTEGLDATGELDGATLSKLRDKLGR
jgi:hypothetical protein